MRRTTEIEDRRAYSEAKTALRDAVKSRSGWQYDPRTGDANFSVVPLHKGIPNRGPNVGCIAYVRAKRSGGGYESIVKAQNGYAAFPGSHDDPRELLVMVESWLQRNLLGIAATEVGGEKLSEFADFLISYMGEEEGRKIFGAYLIHLASME